MSCYCGQSRGLWPSETAESEKDAAADHCAAVHSWYGIAWCGYLNARSPLYICTKRRYRRYLQVTDLVSDHSSNPVTDARTILDLELEVVKALWRRRVD